MAKSMDWLIFDMSYLAHRSYYAIPGLSFDNIGTSVLFGIMRDIQQLSEGFGTTNICYCFDSKTSLREKIYPAYKEPRRNLKPKEAEAKAEIRKQVNLFRTNFLARLGLRNVYQKEGYEADDLIAACHAAIRKHYHDITTVIIVSADKDLYQLLDPERDRTIIYNPTKKSSYNAKSFQDEFGIPPNRWPEVKAIAGCQTDNVPGVRGVGEITAANYLKQRMCDPFYETEKVREKGIELWQMGDQFEVNYKLVTLPYNDIRVAPPKEEKINPAIWDQLAAEMGITSRRSKSATPKTGFALGV